MKKVLINDVLGYDWWTGSGITLDMIQDQLNGLQPGEEVEVEINSPGGSMVEGITIFNLLRDTAKTNPVSVKINCQAMSMASYIALAPRTVDKNAKVTVGSNSIFVIF
jgi:ATP-dependent protease ClpP protease subunit